MCKGTFADDFIQMLINCAEAFLCIIYLSINLFVIEKIKIINIFIIFFQSSPNLRPKLPFRFFRKGLLLIFLSPNQPGALFRYCNFLFIYIAEIQSCSIFRLIGSPEQHLTKIAAKAENQLKYAIPRQQTYVASIRVGSRSR